MQESHTKHQEAGTRVGYTFVRMEQVLLAFMVASTVGLFIFPLLRMK